MSEKGSRGDILVVDDTAHSLWVLSGILTKSGYRVRSASDGATALVMAATSPPPDLILLDIDMPGMDGFEVCRKLKGQASTRDIPVIFISALDEAPEKVTGFEIGGVDYIIKPFQLQEVLARIEMHLTLTGLQKQLERRVAERTAELAQANRILKEEIAARVQAEEALQEAHYELERRVADRTRELSVLYKVASLASRSLDLEHKLARALSQVLEAIGSDAGAIHLLDEFGGAAGGTPGREVLRLVTQHGLAPDLAADVESIPYDRDAGGWVIGRDRALVVPGNAADPRAILTLAIDPGVYVGAPLRVAGRTLGVLGIIRRKDQPFLGVEEISLLTSVADQLGIAVESAWLYKRAEQAAVLEERGRLARHLHDSVTQLLYSVNLFAKSGRNALEAGDLGTLEHCLLKLGASAQQALKEMRLLVYELRPPALEQGGMSGALQRRLDAVEERVGVASQLLVDEMVELPRRVEDELYHIAVEALNNALKHSQAASVIVRLRANRERVCLQVLDDGIGFEPDAVQGQGGLGIMGMRERAARLGAELEITSSPGTGTKVMISM